MRLSFWKLLERTFVLYCLDTRILQATSRILLLSQNSLIKLRLTARLSSLRVRLNICPLYGGLAHLDRDHGLGPICQAVWGVSCMVVWGVHIYAQSTSINSSVHRPFALPRCFFSLFNMPFLAALACLLVCGYSTEAIIDLLPRSS